MVARRIAFAVLLAAASVPVMAQSLGELAAQEKARRERDRKPRPARVYTEEDLQKLEGERPPASAAAAPEPLSAPSAPAETTALAPASSEAEPEGMWGERHRQAKTNLEGAQQQAKAANEEVERLKQDLNPMSTTFSTDPYVILRLQAELTEAQARAAEAAKQVSAAQEALDQFLREARSAGVVLK